MDPFVVPEPLSRRTLLRGAVGGSALLVFGSALGACSDAGSSDAATGAATPAQTGSSTPMAPFAMTHQLGWLKITQFAGFMLAASEGFYADEGLDVTFSSGGPNVIASQQVAAGQSLVGDDDNTTVLQAISEGQPLVMFGTVFQKSPYSVMSLSDNPIASLEDFAGKTVALTEATKPQLEPLLQGAGVDLASVEFVPAGPDPAQLVNGLVDGYFGFATSQGVSLAQQGLDITVAPLNDLGFPSYANVLVTRPEALESDFDHLVSYLRATILGYDLALSDPDLAAEVVVADGAPELDPETEKGVAEAQIDFISNPGGQLLGLDKEKMGQIIQAALSGGSIETELDVDTVMTTDVLDAAYEGLDL